MLPVFTDNDPDIIDVCRKSVRSGAKGVRITVSKGPERCQKDSDPIGSVPESYWQ